MEDYKCYDDPEGDDYVKVDPKSEQFQNVKVRASHCMIYAKSNNTGVFGYKINFKILVQMRFDGYFGFPGGLIDDNENDIDALNRELIEETNFDTENNPVTEKNHIISHFSPSRNNVFNFYAIEVPENYFDQLMKCSINAGEYGKEVLGNFIIPLYTMCDGYRGFPAFICNKFIGNSKGQLLHTLKYLKIMSEEDILRALNAKPVVTVSNKIQE